MASLPKKGDNVTWGTSQGETHGDGREGLSRDARREGLSRDAHRVVNLSARRFWTRALDPVPPRA